MWLSEKNIQCQSYHFTHHFLFTLTISQVFKSWSVLLHHCTYMIIETNTIGIGIGLITVSLNMSQLDLADEQAAEEPDEHQGLRNRSWAFDTSNCESLGHRASAPRKSKCTASERLRFDSKNHQELPERTMCFGLCRGVPVWNHLQANFYKVSCCALIHWVWPSCQAIEVFDLQSLWCCDVWCGWNLWELSPFCSKDLTFFSTSRSKLVPTLTDPSVRQQLS